MNPFLSCNLQAFPCTLSTPSAHIDDSKEDNTPGNQQTITHPSSVDNNESRSDVYLEESIQANMNSGVRDFDNNKSSSSNNNSRTLAPYSRVSNQLPQRNNGESSSNNSFHENIENRYQDDDGNNKIEAPVVFQCANCLHIVGDSLSMASADEDLGTVSLCGAVGVTRSTKLKTSEYGKDLGATYHEMHCEKCKVKIGRIYITTPVALDSLRNMFTFYSNALSSFELGTCDQICNIDEMFGDSIENNLAMVCYDSNYIQDSSRNSNNGNNYTSKENNDSTKNDITAIQKELSKIQNLMVLFHDRISVLESSMKDAKNSHLHNNDTCSRGPGNQIHPAAFKSTAPMNMLSSLNTGIGMAKQGDSYMSYPNQTTPSDNFTSYNYPHINNDDIHDKTFYNKTHDDYDEYRDSEVNYINNEKVSSKISKKKSNKPTSKMSLRRKR